MQLIRRVVRTRRADERAELAPSESAARDWIDGGGVSRRHARTRFALVLQALERVEGTLHDGWQPIVARDHEETKGAQPWPSH
jgi:hypothetical protein